MKRSEINDILRKADAFLKGFGVILPPFAYWPPDRVLGPAGDVIRDRGMGWDITDYGEGRFDDLGLFLFTLRKYAEKIMISQVNQLSPMHRHILKAEDIINRGGGTLVVELFASDAEGGIDRAADITVLCDGQPRTLSAGGRLGLAPGESITLMPGQWHVFWAEGADCAIGEVSTVNDDRTDNVFEAPIDRFSDVAEDEPLLYALVSDYPQA